MSAVSNNEVTTGIVILSDPRGDTYSANVTRNEISIILNISGRKGDIAHVVKVIMMTAAKKKYTRPMGVFFPNERS